MEAQALFEAQQLNDQSQQTYCPHILFAEEQHCWGLECRQGRIMRRGVGEGWADQHSLLSRPCEGAVRTTKELDLLIKWLCPQSAEIERLEAVHIDKPAAALSTAWDRLECGFSSPEAIENALFKRLLKFPKISSKDSLNFQELSDLLL